MTTTKPTTADICAAYHDEYAARKRHWIGGEPEQSDLRGIRQIISHQLAIPVAAVAEALRDQREGRL
jgi:hypothetical protein